MPTETRQVMTWGDGVRKGADGGERLWLLLCQLLLCGNSVLICLGLSNCQEDPDL